jgi:RNA polymerase sigma-70 factor (ECF subfamily)
MLGSVTEAIEVTTQLHPTRPVGSYEAATLACLDRAGARPLPTDLAKAGDNPEGELSQRPEVLWLEPFPDYLSDNHPIDLQLIAALQRLPAAERAAVILHDIEGWPTPRITDLLGPVNLTQLAPGPSAGAADETVLARYREAFEQYDVPAIVTFFTDDAVWEMPPYTSWFRGARNIGRLISTHCPAKAAGDQYLLPLRANGQPAFAVYMRDPIENVHRAFQIQVLTLTAAGIIHAIAFFDLSLFPTFHLPDLLTGLPPNPYDGTPRPHIERLHHPHS